MTEESDASEAEESATWSSPYGPASPSNGAPASVPPVVPLGQPRAAAGTYTPLPPPAPYAVGGGRPYQTGSPAPRSSTPPPRSTTLSIMSMIFGILGLLLACCYGVGILFAAGGVIMGHISQSRRDVGRAMSTTGLLTGYFGIVVSIIGFSYMATGGFSSFRY